MGRGRRYVLIGALFLLGAGLIAGAAGSSRAMPVFTGYAAKYLCSGTFVSGRDPAVIFRDDVAPVSFFSRLVSFRVDQTDRSVRASALGLFPSTAIYREGCGCTLVVGTSPAQLRAQKLLPPDLSGSRPLPREELEWPEGEGGTVDPASLGVDGRRLEQALDRVFSETAADGRKKTRAVLIVYKGRLIGERYAAGFARQMPLLGWSMAKSVTSALVGVLVGEGKLDVAKAAPVPEWRQPGDPRQAITLNDLLHMSSGLAFGEVYAPFHDATRMLFESYDMAAFAASKPLQAKPGAQWNYSSGTANIVARIVRQTIEAEHPGPYYSALYHKFFQRIGMNSVVLEPDPSGTFVGSSYVFATPRDWARFGLLYLQDGVWQGRRILPQGWVKYTTTPAPAAPHGNYGAFFWLNTGAAGSAERGRWPELPDDAYAAEGFQEQKVVIVPSKDLVVVRFGLTTDRGAFSTNDLVRDLLAALP